MLDSKRHLLENWGDFGYTGMGSEDGAMSLDALKNYLDDHVEFESLEGTCGAAASMAAHMVVVLRRGSFNHAPCAARNIL